MNSEGRWLRCRVWSWTSWQGLVVGLCMAIVGCGNGEGPAQAAAKMWAKARAFGTGVEPREPRAVMHSPSSGAARFVAFESTVSNVVPDDSYHVTDVFLFDRETKQTVRVSVSSSGAQANEGSFTPETTPDGRFVVFESLATKLVPGDTNHQRDVFAHDRKIGDTSRVFVNSAGGEANNFSQAPHVSEDGRFVVFESLASNLVPGDTNGVIDIFVRDRQTKQTARVSVASDGMQANNASVNPTLSADGRYVTFESFATNLSPDKGDGPKQTFVHDRETWQTARAPNESTKGTVAFSSTSARLPAERR